MTDLLGNVVDRGTGAGVRARGFTLPAAGKTGTSRDGWFAGYTAGLLAVAWVGFDDGRELGIDGSRSALPIWTDFMIAAAAEQGTRSGEFVTGPGVEFVLIDPATGALASPGCPDSEAHAFVRGTAPVDFCPVHGSGPFSVPGFFEGLGRSISRVFD
jgi:penicillin-binding protein 1B